MGSPRPKTVAVVQARMGSTRLPGKVLEDLGGKTMVERVLERAGAARLVDEVVLATSELASDDPLAALVGSRCVRGSENDVLSRFVLAARATEAELIVRLTADCPLLDPALVDRVLETREAAGADYASNTQVPRTFPHGLDVEVFTRAALDAADREDDRSDWREHVTPYLYRTEGRFVLARVDADEDFSDQRWTVDTPADLALVRRVYADLGPSVTDHRVIRAWMREHPEHASLNADVTQKTVAR